MGSSGATIVEFAAVTKRYDDGAGERPAVDALDLRIRQGEVFGIVGESGAGKSTLLQLINGLVVPDEGQVIALGQSVGELGRSGLAALRRRIGVLFQGIHLLSNRTVRQNVALPLRLARRSAAVSLTREDERRAVSDILAFVGLGDHADRFPAELSGGERQRVGIARALVGRPELLLCDEPTSSLDRKTTGEVLRVLQDARDELGTTVIVVTHDLDVVKAICDRAALVERGALQELFAVKRSDYQTLPDYRAQVLRELGG